MIFSGTIAVLVMTDGRDDLLERTIMSAEDNGVIRGHNRLVIHDDSGDEAHRSALAVNYPTATVIGGERAGFGGAIARAWAWMLDNTHASAVFHLEDDFVFNEHVPLYSMGEILEAKPKLAQIALLRQPWNEAEQQAGGIIQMHPDDYEKAGCCPEHQWIEHRRFFTTNPCLYRRGLMKRGWPQGAHSEGRFGVELFADPAVRCAFWGQGEEWVTHIGHERVGVGY